ncbi:MAG TPA: 23S rRNA (uracil(1939)-C(5))-methyltransferase RlmD [Planctomycetota bacterium]|nr:23S rRNA (uracil(1939)-C(5))-methyltransferase RlmD [Planctomycetota bacterium]
MQSETVPTQYNHKPRRGDRLTVTIERLDSKGQGMGWVEWPPFGRFQVAVRHAPPGSVVEVEVVRRRGAHVDGKRLEWLDRGPHYVEARCAHFGVCGGCSFQNLDYAEQLVQLRAGVERALSQQEVLGQAVVEPVLGMEDPFGYRNKMDFTFGSRRWVEAGEEEAVEAHFALGLHVPFRHDKVLNIHECSIAFPGAAEIVNSARRLAQARGLTAWDLKQHQGLLRHLVLRQGWHSGEVLVYLVTSEDAHETVLAYALDLVAAHPEITTVVQGVHSGLATVAWGEWDRVLYGTGAIAERLLGAEFSIRPKSFFQTNTQQAERLIEVVREEVSQGPHQVVYDLYCGTGILGLMVVPPGGQLLGFEKVESAVQDAIENAERLGHDQAEFVLGDVLEQLAAGNRPRPDVIIVDPPRVGLHPKMLAALEGLEGQRMVYVSCNVSNAARDLRGLQEQGWVLIRVRPLDLFPHTPHVECVLTLERSR